MIESEVFPFPFDDDPPHQGHASAPDKAPAPGRASGKKAAPKYNNPTARILHRRYPILLASMRARVSLALVGPPGWGKSSAAQTAADEIGLTFSSTSVCAQTSISALLGFVDATGTYRPSHFRRAYEHGSLFLLDEFDAGNANVLAVINNSLSTSQCAFPDAMVPRHPDFVLIAAGNTYGTGATRQFVGRNALDAATLDRFAYLYWPEDPDWEMALCSNANWVARVQEVRAHARTLGTNVIISPRASFIGADLLAAGVPPAVVEEMVLKKGMEDLTWQKILALCETGNFETVVGPR